MAERLSPIKMNTTYSEDEKAQIVPLIIRASSGWVPLKFADIWDYRELLYFLVWRDLKVRYKQTVVGVAWVLIQPTFLTLAFSIFFGRLVGVPSDGIPYPLFAYCGILPWQLFAQALSSSANSLVANEGLVTKVYFPRLIIPLAATISALVDFIFAFTVLLVMVAFYGVMPDWDAFLTPLFICFAATIALSVGLWLSALNVQYRDVRYALPFMIQLWFFMTPVVYPSSLVPEPWRMIYSLNPLTAVVDGLRWALLGTARPSAISLMVSLTVTLTLLIGGIHYFRRAEKYFADVV